MTYKVVFQIETDIEPDVYEFIETRLCKMTKKDYERVLKLELGFDVKVVSVIEII